ncbi:MAG: serine hydrolase domain-containing protein, partial [Alphaproteobacteria bacterium]
MNSIEELVEAGFAPVAAAVGSGRIPGAALGLITRDGARGVRFGGHAMVEPESVPLTQDAWFDLASLTKVIHTTTQVLRLVEAGRVGLDDALCQHIPDLFQYDLEAPLRQLTVRQLLTHKAGLPAVVPLYTRFNDPA